MGKLATLMMLCLLPQVTWAKLKCPPPKEQQRYDRIILEAAKKYKVDAALIHAVIKQESCYYRLAVSHTGAEGLMQLMPATARRFNVSNAFIAKQNIHAGTKYLAWLLKRFKGNIRFALAGYNAGEGKVDRYKGIPPYKETQKYVKRVTGFYRQFKGIHRKTNQHNNAIIANRTNDKNVHHRGLKSRLRHSTINTRSGLAFKHKRTASTISAPTILGKRIRVRSVTLSSTTFKRQRKGYTRIYAKRPLARLPNAS